MHARTPNTATSQQWEEDGNAAEHIVANDQSSPPGRICGSFWWWAGLYGSISPQVPCTAINPIHTTEPNAIGMREWPCSVYRPEIFMHHS